MDRKPRIAYIHVSKTGGQSVLDYLKRCKANVLLGKRHHATVAQMRAFHGESMYNGAKSFAVVRHPVERWISQCKQIKRNPNDPKLRDDVKEWAKRDRMSLQHRIMLSQTAMLYDGGELGVDKVFRFEDDVPANLYAWLTEECGLPSIELARKNVTRGPKVELSRETLDFVCDHYVEDLMNFDYQVWFK